jgi:putative transposase
MTGYERRFPLPRNQRLDPHLYQVAGQPCHYTIRTTYGSEPFSNPRFAAIAVECLLEQRKKSTCQVEIYCVMPDHIHAIVTPAVDGASSLTFINRFKGWCGRRLRQEGWQGPLWQSRSYDHLIREDEDLVEIAAYILANPVRKGLSNEPDAYEWSGMPEPLSQVAWT